MTTLQILQEAQTARRALLRTGSKQKDAALHAMADRLWADRDAILAANALDMDAAREHISEVMLDRLALTEERIAAMAGAAVSRTARSSGADPAHGGAAQRDGHP